MSDFKKYLCVGWGGVRDFDTREEATAWAKEEANNYPGHFGRKWTPRIPVSEIVNQEWFEAPGDSEEVE